MSINKTKMDKEIPHKSQHLVKFLEKLKKEVCRGRHLLQHGFDPKLLQGNSLEIMALASSFKQESHLQAMKLRKHSTSFCACPKVEALESESSYMTNSLDTMDEHILGDQKVQLEHILEKIEKMVETFNVETQFVRDREQEDFQIEGGADDTSQLLQMGVFDGTYACLLNKHSVMTEHASRLLEKSILDRHSLIKMCEEMLGNSKKFLSLDIDAEVLHNIVRIVQPDQLEILPGESLADTILEKILKVLVDKYDLVSTELSEARGGLEQHIQNFSKFQREKDQEIQSLHATLESKLKECTEQINDAAIEKLALNNEIYNLKNQIRELTKELSFAREKVKKSREACAETKERISYIQDKLVLAGEEFGLAPQTENGLARDTAVYHKDGSGLDDMLNNLEKYFEILQDELMSCREQTSKVERALQRSNLFFNELTEAIDYPLTAVTHSGNLLNKILLFSEDVVDVQMRAGLTTEDARACKKIAELLVVRFEELQNRIGCLSDELSHAEKEKQKTEREKAVAGLCLEHAMRRIQCLQYQLNESHSSEAYLKEEIQWTEVELEKLLNRIDHLSDQLSHKEEIILVLQKEKTVAGLCLERLQSQLIDSDAHLKKEIQLKEVEQEKLQSRICGLSDQLSHAEETILASEKEKAVAILCLEHVMKLNEVEHEKVQNTICDLSNQLSHSEESISVLEKEKAVAILSLERAMRSIGSLQCQLNDSHLLEARLEEEIQRKEVEKEKLQKRISCLSNQLSHAEGSISFLGKEKVKIEKEKAAAGLCLEHAVKSIGSLQSQLNDSHLSEVQLKKEIQQKEMENEKLQNIVSDLSDQLLHAEQSILFLENENKKTEKEKVVAGLCLEHAMVSLGSLQSQLNESHKSEALQKEEIQQRKVEHETLQKRIVSLSDQLSQVEESILVLEKEKENTEKEKVIVGLCLERALRSIESYQSQLGELHLSEVHLKEQIQQEEVKHEMLQERICNLSDQLSHAEQSILVLEKEQEKIEKEKAVAGKCIEHAMKSIQSLKSQLNDSHLSEAYMKGQIQQKEIECETLQKRIGCLRNQLSQSEETIFNLEKEKGKAEKEKAVLGLCLEHVMRNIGSLQSQLNDSYLSEAYLKEKIHQKQVKHEKLQDKIVHLFDQLSDAEKRISKTEKEKTVAGLCLEHAMRSIELLQDQLNDFHLSEAQLKEEIQQNEVEHEKLQKRIGRLSDCMSRTEEHILVLGKEKEKTEKVKAVVVLCLEHAMRTIWSLQSQLNESHVSEGRLKEKIQQKEDRIGHLSNQLSNAEQSISVLEKEKKQIEKEKGVAGLCLERSMRTIESLQSQLNESHLSEANLKEELRQKEIEHEKQLKSFSNFLNRVDKMRNHQVILRNMIVNEVSRITQVMKWIKGLALKLLSDVSSLKDHDGNSILTPYNKLVEECCSKWQVEIQSIASENRDDDGKWNNLEAFLDLKCQGMEAELQSFGNSFRTCVEVSSEDCFVISQMLLEISNGLGSISERMNSLKRGIDYATSENAEKDKEIENMEMCLMLMVQSVISVNKELETAQGKMPRQQPIKSLVSPAKFSQIDTVYTSSEDLKFLVTSLVKQLCSSVRNLLHTHGLEVSKDIPGVTNESAHRLMDPRQLQDNSTVIEDEGILQSLVTSEAKIAELSNEAEELKISNQDLERTLLRTSTKLHKTVNDLNRMWQLSENLIKEAENLHLLVGIREDEISQLREQLFLQETEMTALQITMDEYRASIPQLIEKGWCKKGEAKKNQLIDESDADVINVSSIQNRETYGVQV